MAQLSSMNLLPEYHQLEEVVSVTMDELGAMIITLLGPVAVGKSTLAKRVRKAFGNKVKVVLEPMEDWLPYFNWCKKNPNPSNAFLIQVKINDHFENVKRNIIPEIQERRIPLVEERSAMEGKEIFAKYARSKGLINDMEWKYLVEKFNDIHVDSDVFVFLNAKVETLMTRTIIRGREFEQMPPKEMREYYSGLVNNYNDLKDRLRLQSKVVFDINAEKCEDEVFGQLLNCLEELIKTGTKSKLKEIEMAFDHLEEELGMRVDPQIKEDEKEESNKN